MAEAALSPGYRDYRERELRKMGFSHSERATLLAVIERGEVRLEALRDLRLSGCPASIAYRIYRPLEGGEQ